MLGHTLLLCKLKVAEADCSVSENQFLFFILLFHLREGKQLPAEDILPVSLSTMGSSYIVKKWCHFEQKKFKLS